MTKIRKIDTNLNENKINGEENSKIGENVSLIKRNKNNEQKNNWKDVKFNVKNRKKERKKEQFHRDMIHELNSLWNQSFSSLRTKKSKEERINKSLKIIGIIKKIMLQNSTTKSIQFMIKHSNDKQRLLIAINLKENFLTLSKDKCGHHILLKLLAYGNVETKVLVCEEMLKHVKHVLVNRFGILILDRILITPECKRFRLLLLQKIYSNLYHKFPAKNNGIPLTLKQIFKKTPEQKLIY